MARVLSSVDDEFQISLLVSRHGWSYLTFIDTDDSHQAIASDVFSDVFDELMRFCDAIIDNVAHVMPLYDEPGGQVWRLTPVEAFRHLMVLEIVILPLDSVADYRGNEPDSPIHSTTVKREALLIMLISELWKTAMLYSEPSYQKDRPAFPLERLHRLTERWERSGMAPKDIRPRW